MDDEMHPIPAELRQFRDLRDGLDRELSSVTATEDARGRLLERIERPVARPGRVVRWAVPLATAAAVVAVAVVPAALKDDPSQRPAPSAPGPAVQPPADPSLAPVLPTQPPATTAPAVPTAAPSRSLPEPSRTPPRSSARRSTASPDVTPTTSRTPSTAVPEALPARDLGTTSRPPRASGN